MACIFVSCVYYVVYICNFVCVCCLSFIFVECVIVFFLLYFNISNCSCFLWLIVFDFVMLTMNFYIVFFFSVFLFRFFFLLFNIVFVYLHIFILFQWIIVVFCISFYVFVVSCVCISFFFNRIFYTIFFWLKRTMMWISIISIDTSFYKLNCFKSRWQLFWVFDWN